MALLLAGAPARADETNSPEPGSGGRAPGVIADVRIRGPGLPELQARAPGDAWQHACVVPCTRRLDLALDYRVAGDGLVASDVFRLPPVPRVRVDVAAGSPMLATVGTILIVGGVLFGVGGGTILVLPGEGDRTVVGVGFIAAGAISATVGILARIFSETHVTLTPEAP